MCIHKGKYVRAINGTRSSIIAGKEYLITNIIKNKDIYVAIDMPAPYRFSKELFETYFGKCKSGNKSINPNIKVL